MCIYYDKYMSSLFVSEKKLDILSFANFFVVLLKNSAFYTPLISNLSILFTQSLLKIITKFIKYIFMD